MGREEPRDVKCEAGAADTRSIGQRRSHGATRTSQILEEGEGQNVN